MNHSISLGAPLSVVENIIDEWIPNEDHRTILKYRHLQGYTFERIAEIMGLSVTTVKRIVYKDDEILSKKIPK